MSASLSGIDKGLDPAAQSVGGQGVEELGKQYSDIVVAIRPLFLNPYSISYNCPCKRSLNLITTEIDIGLGLQSLADGPVG